MTLANSPTVGTAMNTPWFDEVGYPIDDASKAYFVGQFAGGSYGIADRQAWLASTSAAVTAVTNVFQQALSRAPSGSDLSATQGNLANGSTTIAMLRSAAAYSAEVRGDVTATYNATLGRDASAAELDGSSAHLASGYSTQQSIKTNAAYSPEARGDIAASYDATVGRDPSEAELHSERRGCNTSTVVAVQYRPARLSVSL